MLLKISMAFALSVSFVPASAIAATGDASKNAGKEQAADYDTKKVCKKFPPPTGSRLGPRKVCRTQAQWDAEAQEKDKEMDRMQGRWSHQGS